MFVFVLNMASLCTDLDFCKLCFMYIFWYIFLAKCNLFYKMWATFSRFFNPGLISQCAIFNIFHWHSCVKLCIWFFFSLGKKPIGIQDLINEALHQERMRLKSKVKQIKELLLKPETQANIRRELFGERLINNISGNDVDFSKPLTWALSGGIVYGIFSDC